LQAFKGLETSMKLVVAGGADRSSRYVRTLQRLGDSRVIFTGHVNEEVRDELLSNAYLYVHPSDVEGLAATLLQALSFGNCALVSDIPENLEAVGGAGYSFPRGDVSGLRASLRDLIANPRNVEAARAMARHAVAARYDWDTVAGKLEELYLTLVQRP